MLNSRDPQEALGELLNGTLGTAQDASIDPKSVKEPNTDNKLSDRLMTRFTMWEMEQAVSQASTASAAGPDGITNKDLKSLSDILLKRLLDLFTQILEDGERPDAWKLGEGVPLPKSGKDRNQLK